MNQFAGFDGAAGGGDCVIFTLGTPLGRAPGLMMPGNRVLVDRVE